MGVKQLIHTTWPYEIQNNQDSSKTFSNFTRLHTTLLDQQAKHGHMHACIFGMINFLFPHSHYLCKQQLVVTPHISNDWCIQRSRISDVHYWGFLIHIQTSNKMHECNLFFSVFFIGVNSIVSFNGILNTPMFTIFKTFRLHSSTFNKSRHSHPLRPQLSQAVFEV